MIRTLSEAYEAQAFAGETIQIQASRNVNVRTLLLLATAMYNHNSFWVVWADRTEPLVSVMFEECLL